MKRRNKIFIGILAAIVVLYLGLVVIAYLPRETIPVKELAGKDSRFITVNGHTIHFLKSGEGPPFILVHGFGLSTYSFRKLVPLLADRYTVYALDLLGFGLSDKPPDGSYDLESQADLLISFMDALRLPSATIVGHSLGGIVACYAAIIAPSRVDKLVIIEPGFYAEGAPAFTKYLFFPLHRVMAKQFYTRAFQKQFQSRLFYNKSLLTDEVLDSYMLATKTPDALDAFTAMSRDVGAANYEGISERVPRPTLIVWGQNDERAPTGHGERLKREIKGSQLMYIEGTGHMVPEEKPQELANLIRDFSG